jgi:hypothetical protein
VAIDSGAQPIGWQLAMAKILMLGQRKTHSFSLFGHSPTGQEIGTNPGASSQLNVGPLGQATTNPFIHSCIHGQKYIQSPFNPISSFYYIKKNIHRWKYYFYF